MKLRDHPLMTYHSLPNWPPRWLPRHNAVGAHPRGEIGVLVEVAISESGAYNHQPPQLFLFMKDGEKSYVSAILFSESEFCRKVGELLKKYCGRTLQEIGGLDVGDL